MKMIKPALLSLLLAAALGISWYYTDGSGPFLVDAPDPHASAYGHIFRVVPPEMDAQDAKQSKTRDRLIFLNFDDGRFLFTNAPDSIDTLQVIYAYRANLNGNSNYEPYAEATEIYSDKKPPPSVSRMIMESSMPVDPYISLDFTQHLSVGSAEISSNDPYKIAMTVPVKLAATRRIVPESGLSYVATVENTRRGTEDAPSCGTVNAALTLNYDPAVLEFKGAKDGYAHTPYPATTANSGGTVSITLPNMRELEQRSVVYVFATKAGVKAGENVTMPQATVEFSPLGSTPLSPMCQGPFADSLPDQRVVFDTHDPNHKMITPNEFCVDYNGNLTYRIDFQNDGFAPTKTIVIEDELDFLYDATLPASNLVQTKAYLGNRFHSSPVPVKIGNRKYRFTLANAALNGTNQAGYGTKFSDASTKGFLEFKVSANRLREKPNCSAVCNQAKIYFDCNPPILTNTALSAMTCWDCNRCIVDTIMVDTSIGVLKGPVSILPSLNENSGLKTLLSSRFGVNNYRCKWYPASKVSDAEDINATASSNEMTNYTLVASGKGSEDCGRVVYQRTFIPGCDLSVNASYTSMNSTGCPERQKFTLHASLSGHYDPGNLSWALGSECQTGGADFSKGNVYPGTYRIVVTDKTSGCTSEAVVNIPYAPIVVDDPPGDCMVNLIVHGGDGNYTYQWQWDGALQTTLTNSTKDVDPSGKSNISVTVTDGHGCNKVFRPGEQCPLRPPGSNWPLYSALGLGIAGAAYWLYKKRNSEG